MVDVILDLQRDALQHAIFQYYVAGSMHKYVTCKTVHRDFDTRATMSCYFVVDCSYSKITGKKWCASQKLIVLNLGELCDFCLLQKASVFEAVWTAPQIVAQTAFWIDFGPQQVSVRRSASTLKWRDGRWSSSRSAPAERCIHFWEKWRVEIVDDIVILPGSTAISIGSRWGCAASRSESWFCIYFLIFENVVPVRNTLITAVYK